MVRSGAATHGRCAYCEHAARRRTRFSAFNFLHRSASGRRGQSERKRLRMSCWLPGGRAKNLATTMLASEPQKLMVLDGENGVPFALKLSESATLIQSPAGLE